MKTQLYVPERIKVGYQNRSDTYSALLGYVIYFDHTGKLRKETSWQGWRDKKIEPAEFDNKPLRGFVLNRDVGGKRGSWGHDVRMEKVRVYDPRDFEIEITIPNMLFILQECNCNRGKGLDGEFAYAWDRNNLVLLPASSKEYKECIGFTKLQSQSVHMKDLIKGAMYTTRTQEQWVYVGRFHYHHGLRLGSSPTKKPRPWKELMHVFYRTDAKEERNRWQYVKDLKKIAKLESKTVASNYAELVEEYNKSAYGSPVVKLFLKLCGEKEEKHWHTEIEPGVYLGCTNGAEWNEPDILTHIQSDYRYWLDTKTGAMMAKRWQAYSCKPGMIHRQASWNRTGSTMHWIEPTGQRLWVELASGAQFEVSYYPFEGSWY